MVAELHPPMDITPPASPSVSPPPAAPRRVLNVTFDVDVSSYVVPEDPEESSLDDLHGLSTEEPPEEQPLQYEVLETGSKQGKPALVDTQGFSYTVKVLFSTVERAVVIITKTIIFYFIYFIPHP